MQWFEKLGTDTVALIANYGMRVLGVLVAIVLAWIIGGWVRRLMMRAFEKANFDATLSRFFSALARYVIISLSVIGCLGVFGVETASFAAIIAALGLAIGLAFQNTLSNFAAGVMLLVFRPFKVGDWIIVAGITGGVEEIELFTTELTTLDNRKIVIPNSIIFSNPIENITGRATRRCDVSVGVVYAADIDETRRVLEGALATIEWKLAEPESVVFLKGLGSSSVDWQLRIWCQAADYWKTYEAGVRAAKYALDQAGIGIPFPQMDVHLDAPVVKSLGGGRAA